MMKSVSKFFQPRSAAQVCSVQPEYKQADQAESLIERPVGAPEAELMKYFNKTWMPAIENKMTTWVDSNGNYQYDRYLKAMEFVKNRRTSIDVGANLGLFSRRMCEDFNMVHSFEPIPIGKACVARNTMSNNCVIYPFGLGESEYDTEITFKIDNIGASTIGREVTDINKEKKIEYKLKIHIKPLDLFNLKNVDFIKVDIQGYELKMLQGARQTLLENDPVLLIELIEGGREHTEITEYLNTIGYQLICKIGKEGIFSKKK